MTGMADDHPPVTFGIKVVRRLAPETVVTPSTDQCPVHTWRCPSCVCVLTAGHPGLCDVHCQGSPRAVRDGG